MIDVAEAAVMRGLATIAGSLDRLRQEGKDHGGRQGRGARAHQGHDRLRRRSRRCDLVIEAATENVELKLRILRQVDALAQPSALISRRTRRRSRSPRSRRSRRGPAQFLGMHFFNPVPMMALVELIRGLQTVRRDASPRRSAFAKRAGQDADRREEQPGLRRQPHPVPDAQRGDLRAAGRAWPAPRTSTTA